MQYGGHIEIQDGGHQGAFQSWVLIEKLSYRGVYKCAKFIISPQNEIFFDLTAGLTVLAFWATFYTELTSEGTGVSPIQIHQDITWFDHMILAANGNYRPFLTNTAACTALMWLGHWARVRTSCMAPVGRNSRRRVDSWQCREDVSAIHSTRHILDTLQLNAADMPRYQPWTSAVEIAPGSSLSFWSLWVEARKTGTPATSVNSTHTYR